MEAAATRVSAGSLVLAVAIPFLFLHVHYQPDLGFDAGGTHVGISLSDLAVVAVALAGLYAGFTAGFRPLRRGVPVWITAGVFLGIVLLSLSYPLLRDQPYDWHARLVSALKLCEYAALALAVPLILRSRDDAWLPFRALVGWSAVATAFGLLQFLGWVDEFNGRRPAQREPSLLGIHDFAALSGGALALAIVVLALADEELLGRAWVYLALAAGGLGLVLSGAMTGVIGIWLALGVLVVEGISAGGDG